VPSTAAPLREAAAADPDPVVREAAAWALQRVLASAERSGG